MWYVILDLGYDGLIISSFDDELEARERLNNELINMSDPDKPPYAVCLIEGRTVENYGIEI